MGLKFTPQNIYMGSFPSILATYSECSYFDISSDEPHYCPLECHLGDCPPCKKTRTVQCQCGRASTRVECVDVEGRGEYRCQHVCNKKKSCGRHRCNARCCTMTVRREGERGSQWREVGIDTFCHFLLCRKKPTSVIVYAGSGCSVATISVKSGAILGTVSSAGNTVSCVTFT